MHRRPRGNGDRHRNWKIAFVSEPAVEAFAALHGADELKEDIDIGSEGTVSVLVSSSVEPHFYIHLYKTLDRRPHIRLAYFHPALPYPWFSFLCLGSEACSSYLGSEARF